VREAKPGELRPAVLHRIYRTFDVQGPTALSPAERTIQLYDLMIIRRAC